MWVDRNFFEMWVLRVNNLIFYFNNLIFILLRYYFTTSSFILRISDISRKTNVIKGTLFLWGHKLNDFFLFHFLIPLRLPLSFDFLLTCRFHLTIAFLLFLYIRATHRECCQAKASAASLSNDRSGADERRVAFIFPGGCTPLRLSREWRRIYTRVKRDLFPGK